MSILWAAATLLLFKMSLANLFFDLFDVAAVSRSRLIASFSGRESLSVAITLCSRPSESLSCSSTWLLD